MKASAGFYKVVEKETPRVKSATFHPKKPVVIVALHSGAIQEYDYQLGLLVHEFRDHTGPVRAVVFHPLLNIFASGGDDTKIRVWDYHTKRVMNMLEGHKDYVRSLDFHQSQPFLLSASDDQTVRVWNIQSRRLLATLPGHTHYVMCARFFLDDFIVSGSLDQTVRVWDYKNINEKKGSILGLPNVYVKQILDAHEKGINGIAVHQSTFATVSDDKEVKVWEFDGSSVSEKEVLYHHQGIVSSVLITNRCLISNGEDGILAVHSLDTKTTRKFVIEGRFWCLAGHEGLYCAGHDTGFYVFSLENTERVFCYDDGLYYVRDRSIYFNNFKTEERIYVAPQEVVGLQRASRTYEEEPAIPQGVLRKNCLLVQYADTFDLIADGAVAVSESGAGLLYQGHVVLKRDSFLYTVDLWGRSLADRAELACDQIFRAHGCIVAVRGHALLLVSRGTYQVTAFRNIGFDVKTVVACETAIAVVGRNDVLLLSYSLAPIAAAQEIAPINSGFFSEDTFFYSTIRQVKFLNSDSGILKSLDNAFVFHRDGDTMYYLGREVGAATVDMTEFRFKAAVRKNHDDGDIRAIIESGDLPGLAPLAFLMKNHRGDMALPYVTDPRQKFELCLSNGRHLEALELCNEIGDEALYRKLADAALRDCHTDIAESCLMRLGDFQGLFMLYLCSRQDAKIRDLYSCAPLDVKVGIAKYLRDDDFIIEALGGAAGCAGDKCVPHSSRPASGDAPEAESTLYSSELLLQKRQAFGAADPDWRQALERALSLTTAGKFNQALSLFRSVLYTKIDDEHVRREVGPYIAGLSVEKRRRKVQDPQRNIEMSLYFSSLPLQEVHKTLAMRSAMKVLFRNGNIRDAKQMAQQLGAGPDEVLESTSDENRFEVVGDVFCYDVCGFRESGLQCPVCYAWCSVGGVCACCEVGLLQ